MLPSSWTWRIQTPHSCPFDPSKPSTVQEMHYVYHDAFWLVLFTESIWFEFAFFCSWQSLSNQGVHIIKCTNHINECFGTGCGEYKWFRKKSLAEDQKDLIGKLAILDSYSFQVAHLKMNCVNFIFVDFINFIWCSEICSISVMFGAMFIYIYSILIIVYL